MKLIFWISSLLLMVAVLSGCGEEDATPIDPANPPTTELDLTGVTHLFEPSPEMIEAAEAQCRDNPDLDEGYVKAVDPATEAVVSEYSVDCSTLN